MEIKLVVVNGVHAGREIRIRRAKFVVGRSKECQLRPGCNLVSRQHCAIAQEDGRLVLKDLGSTNGTFVNGDKVEAPRVLNHGDRISIGTMEFDLRIDEAAKTPEEPQEKTPEAKAALPEPTASEPAEPEPVSAPVAEQPPASTPAEEAAPAVQDAADVEPEIAEPEVADEEIADEASAEPAAAAQEDAAPADSFDEDFDPVVDTPFDDSTLDEPQNTENIEPFDEIAVTRVADEPAADKASPPEHDLDISNWLDDPFGDDFLNDSGDDGAADSDDNLPETASLSATSNDGKHDRKDDADVEIPKGPATKSISQPETIAANPKPPVKKKESSQTAASDVLDMMHRFVAKKR